MMEAKKYDISVGSGIISIFQDLKFEIERCFAEFIDNSLQSFLDHKEELKALNQIYCKVDIFIDENNDQIIIQDNSYGMNEEEFQRAIKLNSLNPRKEETNRLSIYGIGLKYAAVSLGDEYQITSTRYNENFLRNVIINVPYLRENNPEKIDVYEGMYDPNQHYTRIKIKNLRINFNSSKLEKLKAKLGYIYEHYINNEELVIVVNFKKVNVPEFDYFVSEDDEIYKDNFVNEFKTESGKTFKYSGWIGILETGKQDIAGFKLIQAGRCIHPFYKPEKIFGKGNDYAQQRIVGEVVFDSNLDIVTRDKQDLKLSEIDEDSFIESLKSIDIITDYLKVARQRRKNEEKEKRKSSINKSINKTKDELNIPKESNNDLFKYDLTNEVNNDSNFYKIPEEKHTNENLFKEDRVEKNFNLNMHASTNEENKLIDFIKLKDNEYHLEIYIENKKFKELYKKGNDVCSFIYLLIDSLLKLKINEDYDISIEKIIECINNNFGEN